MKTQILLNPTGVKIADEVQSLALLTDLQYKAITARMKSGKCLQRARGAVKMHLVYQLMRQAEYDVNSPCDEFVNPNGEMVRSWEQWTYRTSNGCLLASCKTLCNADTKFYQRTHLTVRVPLDESESIYEATSPLDYVMYHLRISWG
jgi:hypothetical protein